MEEIGTVAVQRMDFETQRLPDCTAYTVNADGSLKVICAGGSIVDFAVEEWIDVRFEP